MSWRMFGLFFRLNENLSGACLGSDDRAQAEWDKPAVYYLECFGSGFTAGLFKVVAKCPFSTRTIVGPDNKE